MSRILCIGMSDETMKTRRMILEKAGHTVTEAKDLREVMAACRSHSFSVAVLGQTLPQKEKLRVSDVVRSECPEAKILELHTGVATDLPSADGHLHVATGAPEGLVEYVNALAFKRKRRGA